MSDLKSHIQKGENKGSNNNIYQHYRSKSTRRTHIYWGRGKVSYDTTSTRLHAKGRHLNGITAYQLPILLQI